MGNLRKAEGTAWEVAVRQMARDRGYRAWRLDEGGSKDAGDIAIEVAPGKIFILECRQRQQMNIHAARDKAERKTHSAEDTWEVVGIGVAWKRLLELGPDQTRRVRAGAPIGAVDLDTFFDLLEGKYADERDPVS